MIYDAGRFRRRPKKSTTQQKRWERCVCTMTRTVERTSQLHQGTGDLTVGDQRSENMTAAGQFWYNRNRIGGYLGNVGLNG